MSFTLSPEWQATVIAAATRRFTRRRAMGSTHRYGFTEDQHTLDDEVRDLGGEIACGFVLGRCWVDSDEPDPEGDLGYGVQVRTTKYTTGRLWLVHGDHDEHAFFLATGSFPTYTIRGWIYGSEGKLPERWRTLGDERRPAFWSEQSQLRPVDEWLAREAARRFAVGV